MAAGNEVNNLAEEDDEVFLRRSRALGRDWPQTVRDHVDSVLRQLHRRRAIVPKSLTFVPIMHARDDPKDDTELEIDIYGLFESEVSADTVVVSGENYGVPL